MKIINIPDGRFGTLFYRALPTLNKIIEMANTILTNNIPKEESKKLYDDYCNSLSDEDLIILHEVAHSLDRFQSALMDYTCNLVKKKQLQENYTDIPVRVDRSKLN